jgi:transcriptional regulator with XRE-family HTH domain
MEKMASSSQLNQQCAKLLKAARKKQGLTQWQLAERLGCQQPLVAKIERAARRLDVAEFVDVAQAIGVDPSKIIKKLLAEPATSAPRR